MADNPNSLISSDVMQRIGEVVRGKAKALSRSSTISNAIVVETVPPTKTGQVGIKLVVRNVPYARAMEYGSGTHSQRNFLSPKQKMMKGTYEIKPKNPNGVLAFHWDKADPIRLQINRQKRASKLVHSDPETVAYYQDIARRERGEYMADWVVKKEKKATFKRVEKIWSGGDMAKYGTYSRLVADKSGKYVGRTSDGKYLFNYVDHPGIKAVNSEKGYMRPALAESKDDILKLISEDALKNVKLKIRAIFSRPGGINK